MAEKLIRTSYVDVSGQPRQGTTALRESRVDVERYVRPSLAAHASSLHGFGVGSGLEVTAAIGATEVTVGPGVALDSAGRHLVVAEGGAVKLEDQTLAPVSAAGVTVPTGGRTGSLMLTLGWAETFDKAAYQANQVFQLMETPSVEWHSLFGYVDDGTKVVLAQVNVENGTVKELKGGFRWPATIGVGRLVFQRAVVESAEMGVSTARNVEYASLYVDRDDVLQVPASVSIEGGASLSGGPQAAPSYFYSGVRGDWFVNSGSSSGWILMQRRGGGVSIGFDQVSDFQPNFPKLVVEGLRNSPHLPSRAALFRGDVEVVGTLKKSLVQFRIDHPNAPDSQYLNHSVVESDEMKNVYDGVVVLDDSGAAEVELPGWFEALNDRVRYQLTPIGGPAPDLHVAAKVSGGRFRIAGGRPGQEVSWQLTGVRRDAYAVANPLVVEEDKPQQEQGTYLHPEVHGAPEERFVLFGQSAVPAGKE
ncbi:hypothetical protein SK854_35110 [Lentzea sp. BCCO 10_0061]|uniref:Uncharacterized protein n=1 Tax=Lentzea sokolovensis TaxID=3095429 RepID=A0ABU4V6L5_9PSEU|nr:hypothetical protein [Lentzea sp. BCCO 10_0061]MDX8147384.1 hypothetical protein [Lentzea sp. BCCO 10_0061]